MYSMLRKGPTHRLARQTALLVPLLRRDRHKVDLGDELKRRLGVAGVDDLVAPFPGRHPRHQPLARIDPQFAALNMFVVNHNNAVALDPIAACVVSNLNDLVREAISLRLARARVLLPKSITALGQPAENRRLAGHGVIAADYPQALPARQPLANLCGSLGCIEARSARHWLFL